MSIQKRTYEKVGSGGRKVKRTVWRVRWLDLDGQHRSKQFDSYADAQAFDGQAKAGGASSSGATGQLPIAGRSASLVTLADLWAEWFPVYAATVAPATADIHETCWTAHVEPLLGSRPLADFVTSFPVEQLHADMARRKVGPSAIRKSVSLLKMLLDAGVSYRLIGFNGARGYYLGRRVSAKRQRPLVMIPAAKAEQMRLDLLARRRGGHGVTAVEHNLPTIALLSLRAYAGLRPAEALALRWRDLDELHSELLAGERVANGDEAQPKTPTSKRRVPIIAPLMDDLLAWRAVTPYRGTDAPIIASPDGLPWGTQAFRNWTRTMFAPAAETVGLPKVRAYDLRHTWCMSQIRCGWDLLELAERAGSSAETIATSYLSQPTLTRDLGIPDDAPTFEQWVIEQRQRAADPQASADTGT